MNEFVCVHCVNIYLCVHYVNLHMFTCVIHLCKFTYAPYAIQFRICISDQKTNIIQLFITRLNIYEIISAMTLKRLNFGAGKIG